MGVRTCHLLNNVLLIWHSQHQQAHFNYHPRRLLLIGRHVNNHPCAGLCTGMRAKAFSQPTCKFPARWLISPTIVRYKGTRGHLQCIHYVYDAHPSPLLHTMRDIQAPDTSHGLAMITGCCRSRCACMLASIHHNNTRY